MTVKEEDLERFAVILARTLQQARSVSDSQHYDHHRWITAKIERENAWRKFWDDMRAHLVRWGMVGALSGLFYALWLGVKAWVRVWLKTEL